MDSDRLPFGFIPGQQRNEKYEWQQLILHQSEQATREHALPVAKLNHPLHAPNSDRVEDSVTATEISYRSRGYCDLHRLKKETWNQPLDRLGVKELKRYRNHASHKCGLKRTRKNSSFYDHRHSAAIPCPESGTGAPSHLSSFSCSSFSENNTGGYHGQGHAYHSHSTKQTRFRFSPDPASTRSSRYETIPSVKPVHDCGKGTAVNMHSTVRPVKAFSFNHEGSTRNRHRQEQHLHTDVGFPDGRILKIEESTHRSNILRDEVWRAHSKKPFNELHAIHCKQRELSNDVDFCDHLDSRLSYNCNEKRLRRKRSKHGWENNYNGVCVRRHWRNQRYGDLLSGHNSKGGSDVIRNDNREDVMRNDNREGFSGTLKEVDRHVPKGNCHPKKNILTAARCTGSTNSDDNSDVTSPKYSSKTFASSDGQKLNEGSRNIILESDKWLSDVASTKRPRKMGSEEASRGSSQHSPVVHIEKDVHTKESDSVSPSEVIHDCLILWQRLRKDSGAEAETVVRTDKLGTTNRVYIGGRARDGRAAASGSLESDDENKCASESASVSSESNDESGSASENSEQYRSAMPSARVQKCGEGRTRRKLEQSFGCLRGSKCNESPQKTMAEQGLKCNLEFPPEANSGEITQQKEHDKLSSNQLSIVYPDARMQINQRSCSDASKVDQAAASHPDISVLHKVFQHKAINDHLDARIYKLGVCSELEDEEGDIANWDVQKTTLSTGPTRLDQKTVALYSLNYGNLKAKALECSNQKSKRTTISAPKLDERTANNCPKQPVHWSSGCLCRDLKILPTESDSRAIQWDIVNCNIFKNNQECSALVDFESNFCQKETVEVREMSSDQQIFQQLDSDRTNSHADWTSSVIPDLNILPSMGTNEEFKASEEMIYQISGIDSKPEAVNNTLSGPFGEPIVQEEQHEQPEPNELIMGVCEREGSNRLPISNSHSRQPELGTVEGTSTSIDAFKGALCEFIKNILKPLWEDGVLSREVHKIIVKKAVEKVTLGTKIPLTDIAIRRFLSDESQSVEQLVQAYVELYVGRQILKRTIRSDNI